MTISARAGYAKKALDRGCPRCKHAVVVLVGGTVDGIVKAAHEQLRDLPPYVDRTLAAAEIERARKRFIDRVSGVERPYAKAQKRARQVMSAGRRRRASGSGR